MLHRLEPRVKVIAALATIVLVSLNLSWGKTPSPLVLSEQTPISLIHLGVGAGLLIAIELAGIPWRYVILRLAVFAPFALMLSLSIPLSRGLEGGWTLMGGVLAKALLSWTTVLVLVNTTPFDSILSALRRLRLPAVLVAVLSFTYRYLFVLVDELNRMSRARSARTFRRNGIFRLQDLASVISMLLLRSFERAERVHRAMLARGFDGDMKTLDRSSPLSSAKPAPITQTPAAPPAP
ncbi:MAG: cobalt ECF transporter T component CbiQ [Planctomycetales bacterium]